MSPLFIALNMVPQAATATSAIVVVRSCSSSSDSCIMKVITKRYSRNSFLTTACVLSCVCSQLLTSSSASVQYALAGKGFIDAQSFVFLSKRWFTRNCVCAPAGALRYDFALWYMGVGLLVSAHT